MTPVTKVLEISPWEETLSDHIYADAQIDRWDFLSPLPKEYAGMFDAVMANNVLQRFSHHASSAAIQEWANCLRDGGELHIIVPSLEWACREILSEITSPASMVVLYGAQGGDGSVHASGYTMKYLRALLSSMGLKTTKARTAESTIDINGKPFQIHQHYVCAVKGTPELSKE